jgi:2-polyprenyl-3-methyl-5-hydroxy-6-metoxy-1,4-benzoquinol methylase
LFDEIAPLLPVDKGQAILEIGAGFGYLINLLLDMGYRNVVVADLSKDLLEVVRNRFSDRLIGAYWCDGGDILACNPNTFDLIFLYDVLEHITLDSLDAFVFSLKGALTEGGKVIVRTPNMALPLSSFSRYIDITHKIGFTEFSLRQLFYAAGFSSVNFVSQHINRNWKQDLMFRFYKYLLRKMYILEGRTIPSCYDKNLLVEVWK